MIRGGEGGSLGLLRGKVILGCILVGVLGSVSAEGQTPPELVEARRHLEQGNLDGARKACTAWVQQHGMTPDAQVLHGEITYVSAQRAEAKGMRLDQVRPLYGDARQHFETAWKQDPNAFPAVARQAFGHTLFIDGEWSRALELLTPKPGQSSSPAAVLLQGQCHQRLGQPDRALAAFAAGVKSAPQHHRLQIEHARALHALGRSPEAIAALQAYLPRLEGAPADERHWTVLYEIYRFSLPDCDFETAHAALTQACELFPKRTIARLELSATLYRMGDMDGCARELDRLLAPGVELRRPDRAQAHYRRGLVRQHRQDFTGARTDFEEALRWRPNHAPSLQHLGKILIRLGEKEEGLATLKRFRHAAPIENDIYRCRNQITRDPRNATAQAQLIQNLLKLERLDDAGIELAVFRRRFPAEASRAALFERALKQAREETP